MYRKQSDSATNFDTYDLGELIKEFRSGIAVPVLSGLFSLFFLMTQSQMILSQISSKPVTEVLRNSMQAFILVNVFFACTLLCSLFYLKTCIFIFKDGLIYQGPLKEHIVRFEDIQTLWVSSPATCYQIHASNPSTFWNQIQYFGRTEYIKGSSHAHHQFSWLGELDTNSFCIRTYDYLPINISIFLNLPNISLLANYIEKGYFKCKFPQILQDYESGHPLSFGPCTLDRNGLVIVRDRKGIHSTQEIKISWLDIQDLSINKIREDRTEHHYLSMFINNGRRKRCVKIRMRQIPNCNIFITLVLRAMNRSRLT